MRAFCFSGSLTLGSEITLVKNPGGGRMQSFVILESSAEGFPAIVMATGLVLPQESLAVLEQALQAHRVCGEVVFDLLMPNGSRHHRFFTAPFDGEMFSPDLRFKPVKPSMALRERTAQYLQAHLELFDLSLLTPAMRYAAKTGAVL